MRAKRFIILFFAAAVAVTDLSAQDTAKVLTLDDCVRIGLDNATSVLLGKNAVKLTGVQLMGAYGQFLPDLTFGANYAYNGGSELYTTSVPTLVDSRQNVMNYQLISSINIFNGFSDFASLKAATLTRSASELNLTRVKQQISLDIAQSYLQVILDRRIVEYATENLNASQQREAQLQELTQVGRKAISDLYQQQALTSSDKLLLIQSEEKVKNDKVMLLARIRLTKPNAYTIAEVKVAETDFGPDYQNVETLVSRGLDQRPDLKSSNVSIAAADWSIKQYQSGYLPKLNLIYGLVSSGGYLNSLYVNNVNELPILPAQESPGRALFGQIYGTIGLNLSWRVFDKLYTKTNVAAGRIYRSNAEINRDDLAIQIESDIRQAYNDYVAALQQIETSNTGLIAARQAYEVIKGRYDIGSSSFIEVSNAQAAQLQAEVNKAQAYIKLSLQKKVLDYLLGN